MVEGFIKNSGRSAATNFDVRLCLFLQCVGTNTLLSQEYFANICVNILRYDVISAKHPPKMDVQICI